MCVYILRPPQDTPTSERIRWNTAFSGVLILCLQGAGLYESAIVTEVTSNQLNKDGLFQSREMNVNAFFTSSSFFPLIDVTFLYSSFRFIESFMLPFSTAV